MMKGHNCVVPWIISNNTICTEQGMNLSADQYCVIMYFCPSRHKLYLLGGLEPGDEPEERLLQPLHDRPYLRGGKELHHGVT